MTDMNQTPHDDRQDEQIDRNLRSIARHLELPQEPSPLQQARWRNAAAPEKGILGMKRKNFWRVLGAGSALAACITIVAVLAGGTQRVNAAQIFAELRESIRRSLWIELEDVQAEGVTANGRMLIVFSDNVVDNGASPTEANGVDASFFDMRVTADDNHPDVPGLDMEVALAMVPDAGWAFLQAHALPSNLFSEVPMAAFFAPAFQSGVLIDLASFGGMDGVNLSASSNSGPQAKFFIRTGGGEENDESESQTESTDEELETLFEFSFQTNPEMGDDPTVDIANDVIHESMFGSGLSAHADTPEMQAALDAHMAMVENFLSGRFTQEDMETFIGLIEDSADVTTVTRLNSGAYLLTASGFELSGELQADVDMSLEVEYREGAGIDRIELINIGEGAGRMRLAFSEDDATNAVFDRAPYGNRPGVRLINELSDFFGAGNN